MLVVCFLLCFFFFSSRRRHTRCLSDWSSDVCSSDLCNTISDSPSPLNQRSYCSGSPFGSSASQSRERMRSEERRVGKECRRRRVMYNEKEQAMHWTPMIT